MKDSIVADSTKNIADSIENSEKVIIKGDTLQYLNKVEPVEKILNMDFSNYYEMLIKFSVNLLAAFVIIFVGFWLARFASRAISKILEKRDSDPGLISFLSSGVNMAIRIMVILTAVTQLGIQTTSFLALLASAGVAIGLSLQGTLSNLAGGILILSLKPFKVGDEIVAQGVSGVVKQIMIFQTILTTGDNKTVIIPNGALSNSNIINNTRALVRRVDLRIKVNYGNNVHHFKEVVQKIINENNKIHVTPAPIVALDELADGAIIFNVFVWTDIKYYGEVKYYMNEEIHKRLPEEGISFPSSSLDVRLMNDNLEDSNKDIKS